MAGGATRLTFCPQIFGPRDVVHGLQGLGFFAGERLLVVIFSGAAKAVEQDSPRSSASERPKKEDEQGDEDYGAEGRYKSNDNATKGGVGRLRCHGGRGWWKVGQRQERNDSLRRRDGRRRPPQSRPEGGQAARDGEAM